MLKNRISIQGKRVVSSTMPAPTYRQSTAAGKMAVKGNYDTGTAGFQPAGPGGAPISTMAIGGPAFNTMFMGIIPEYNENLLLTYYRDCYYYDSVAGATVDIIGTFPFSEWTLTGVDNADIPKYNDSMARLNMRSLLQEVSNNYLVDSAFIGSLVYDAPTKTFQDILVHDFGNASITPQPFYSLDPVITVNTANTLNQFMDAGSPFLAETMKHYPKALLDTFRSGSAVLDPLTTLYLPRKGMQDRSSASYLKRLLPVYLLEKILYRGTLTEATKRLRSTSHITIGDDNWEPNPNEMASILADFQRSELDPLGAWIATRQGVSVADVRAGGDFWKWTDNIDILTPFKLRALGISEAFLSSDAAYASAEAAISVFLENMDAYRKYITYKMFTSKLFPLIAVLNGLYKDPKKVRKVRGPGDLLFNLNNQNNLIIPGVHWHKSLEGKDTESDFDMLEKLSEKGFPIPMKMWASAAGVDINTMVRDLEEDTEIKKQIEKVTGQKAETIGKNGGGDEPMSDNDMQMSMRSSSMGTRPLAAPTSSRRKPLLSRSFDPMYGVLSKSGKVMHAVNNESRHAHKVNDTIAKVSMALRDPHTRITLRKRVQEKLGNTNLNLF